MGKIIDNSDYSLVGKGLNEMFLCVNNKINERMYEYAKKRGILFDCIGNLGNGTARVVSLRSWGIDDKRRPDGFDTIIPLKH